MPQLSVFFLLVSFMCLLVQTKGTLIIGLCEQQDHTARCRAGEVVCVHFSGGGQLMTGVNGSDYGICKRFGLNHRSMLSQTLMLTGEA